MYHGHDMAQWVAHWVGGEVTPGFTIGIPLGLPLKHGAIGNSWRTSPFFGLGKLHTQLPGQNPQVTALCCIRSISFCILRCLGRTPTPSWDKCMATEGFCLGMSGPTFECLGDAPLMLAPD